MVKKIKDKIIELLGGKTTTIVIIEKDVQRSVRVLSSTTIPQVRDTLIARVGGVVCEIKSNGEVKCHP